MSQIVRDLTEITRCGSQYRADALAPFGLKACHASYLTEICAQPGISQDKLSRRICINKSNVARQAVILEENGFVRRVPSQEDKRVMMLYPTEKTLSLLPRIRQILQSWEARITKDLSEAEKDILTGLLGRVKEEATAAMDEEA